MSCSVDPKGRSPTCWRMIDSSASCWPTRAHCTWWMPIRLRKCSPRKCATSCKMTLYVPQRTKQWTMGRPSRYTWRPCQFSNWVKDPGIEVSVKCPVSSSKSWLSPSGLAWLEAAASLCPSFCACWANRPFCAEPEACWRARGVMCPTRPCPSNMWCEGTREKGILFQPK